MDAAGRKTSFGRSTFQKIGTLALAHSDIGPAKSFCRDRSVVCRRDGVSRWMSQAEAQLDELAPDDEDCVISWRVTQHVAIQRQGDHRHRADEPLRAARRSPRRGAWLQPTPPGRQYPRSGLGRLCLR